MTEKPEFVSIYMKLTYFEPETRQYLQRSIQGYFEGVQVEVKIPNQEEYLKSYNEETQEVILTPLGMRYAVDMLHGIFNPEVFEEETEAIDEEDFFNSID